MTSQELSFAISELYAKAIETGQLTRSNQRVLMEAVCTTCLGQDERAAVDRLLWSVGRGRFELVED